MDFLIFVFQLFIAAIVIVLIYQTLKYTHTMWRFKNRKKTEMKIKILNILTEFYKEEVPLYN